MNILAVPIVPTGLSGDPAHASLGGIIGVIIILVAFIGLVIIHEVNNKRRARENKN
jgi:hypothetical protein